MGFSRASTQSLGAMGYGLVRAYIGFLGFSVEGLGFR